MIDLNWYVRDKKAKNVSMIIKGVGKKFSNMELLELETFFKTISYVRSIYIEDGYLDIYYDYKNFYPDKNMMIKDGF